MGACGAAPSVWSPVSSAGVFFLSESRVLSPVVVAVFFFFFDVSPARPNGPACVCRSATSAASGASGARASTFGPPLCCLACLACLARSLKRVFCVALAGSSGFTGS